jgi:mono/diheme cytochrome c family protein
MNLSRPLALRALTIALMPVCLAVTAPSVAQENRGQGLYENHCQSCHDNTVHTRTNSKPESIRELRAWVASMSVYTDLGWGNDEIDDLTQYLNRRIYHFQE